MEKYTFEDFVEIVRQLRERCPWDSVQTHRSLEKCLKDETKEVIEGIDILEKNGDGDNLCEGFVRDVHGTAYRRTGVWKNV